MSETPEPDNNPPDQLPAEVRQAAAAILAKLPEKLRGDVSRLVGVVVEQTKFHSGPLPDPDTLERYGQLIDGGCERLMRLVEQEAQHRHTQEDRVVRTNATLALRGQWISVVLVVLLAAIGTLLTLKGYPSVGSVIFATTIAAVAAVFIYGKSKEGQKQPDRDDEPKPPTTR